MTRRVICPYCMGHMELRVLGLNKNKVYFYECTKCLSRSPMTWNEVTANSMARMRDKETVMDVKQPNLKPIFMMAHGG